MKGDFKMRDLKLRRNESGISLIALVITIIVIIILAAIAFNSSTSTIEKANYSKFVSNISEVQDAIQTKTVTIKGFAMASGMQVTDAQVYNYVAKGGSSENDFLPEAQVPAYTIIDENADIGIDLPVMKVNTPTETGVKVKYVVTKNGTVFIWPPYKYEEEYNIRDKETVDKTLIGTSEDVDIKVAGEDIKLKQNANGTIQSTTASDSATEEVLAKIKVGDYVNYVPTAVQNVETDSTKTGYDKEVLSTDTDAKWRILNIDSGTGKVMITTEGYVNKVTLKGVSAYFNGVSELHRLCGALYSDIDKGITARSMTIEDLNKACGYTPSTDVTRCAWYLANTSDSDLKDVIIGEHTYTAKKHIASLASGVTYPRFYNWDDKNGITHQSTSETDYIELKSKDEPVLITQTMYWYNPSGTNATIGDILKGNDTNRGWLASSFVGVDLQNASANYGLHTAYVNRVDIYNLMRSTGYQNTPSFGLRPVISISAKLIDVSNTSTDGTSALKAWNIK